MKTGDSARRSLAAALRWQWQRRRLSVEAEALLNATRALGFPRPGEPAGGREGHREPAWAASRPLGPLAVVDGEAAVTTGERRGVTAATVCTLDHLHFALALATSLRRHHPEITPHILVVDGDDATLPDAPGCRLLRGSEVGLFADPYLALKLSAADLCCAAKPFLLSHLARATAFAVIVYLDADIYLFAPLTRLLAQADRSTFVVFPHTLAPMPHPEYSWERPTLGQLALAGMLNAGLFVFRVGEAANRFLATWRGMVTEPGAFQATRGAQTEQNSFNWILAFAEDVHVMRDTAYNVAYWNLHERSLRWTATTAAGPVFTVDAQPLVVFHFSGYRPEDPDRLSLGDFRSSVHSDRTLGQLLAFYSGELAAHGCATWSAHSYRFGRFPSGIAIDRRLRDIFKEYEAELRLEADPFSAEGEALYCRALLSPAPGTGSLLPLLLSAIYRERSDVRAYLPDADLVPEPLLRWFSLSGVYEMQYAELFDRHRPVVPRSEQVRALVTASESLPEVFATCAEPLGRDRQLLLARLEAAQHQDVARSIRELECEIYAASPIYVVWRLVRERADLRERFPDLLDSDAEAFASWLRVFGTRLELLDPGIAERFARAARGGSLARIFSFVNRHSALIGEWPLALAGVDCGGFTRFLLHRLRAAPEYDLDDVVMYMWTMEERPWLGLPLVLELLVNGRREPSPLSEAGQEALLAPLLDSRSEFRAALADYRQRYGNCLPSPAATRRRGVNLFGFFRSPIGLGNMSTGLATALRSQQLEVCENLLGNIAMEPELRPDAFVRRYDFNLDTNLFVSFPHLEDRLFETYPAAVLKSRHNVVYLAWEQREANPRWADSFRDFDQVWALSSFAAHGLSEALGREVVVVPCALDFAGLRPATLAGDGLDGGEGRPRSYTFLHTFDANSSIERKNPEAVVAAFALAFRPPDRARLLLRVANAHRWPHRRRLQRLAAQAAATGLDIQFVCQPMTRAEVLALLAAADCYVSLHRAEGFGLTCAEAMALGKPTIATGYSGNLEFMDAESSLLVDFREVEVRTAEGPFRGGSLWAEPSLEHGAEQMRWVYANRAAARALGERARAKVVEKLSPANVGATALAALRRLG